MSVCHTSCLLKFGHQTLNCPSIRYIVPAKIFPALPMCQKNWFCGKVRLDDFYLLLRSIAPLGSILVSKESPRAAVYSTWKIWLNFETILNGILKIFKNVLEDGFRKTKTETLKVNFEKKKISNSLTEKELCAPIMLTSTSKISKNAGGTGPSKDMAKKNKLTILNPLKIILGEWITT